MQRLYKSTINVLLSSIKSLSAKYDLAKDAFTAWYDTIISKVEERISLLVVKCKFKFHQTKPILQDKEVLDCLDKLHEKFGAVSIEKASNNVLIICKKIYVQKIFLEVGIYGNFSNTIFFKQTY